MTAPGFCADADADGWTAADVTRPCIACGWPAFMRDPAGKPRHRVDCDARPFPVPTSQGATP